MTVKKTVLWTCFWVGLAIIFNIGVYYYMGCAVSICILPALPHWKVERNTAGLIQREKVLFIDQIYSDFVGFEIPTAQLNMLNSVSFGQNSTSLHSVSL